MANASILFFCRVIFFICHTDGDTVTATMPSGNEPTDAGEYQKLAIRVLFSSGAIMGTDYVYEWKPVE